jgi:MFS family permease
MAGSHILRDNRDYRRYWLAKIISNFGTQLSMLAFPLLVLSLGDGPNRAAAIATCMLATRFLLRMTGGNLADRFDRRWLMLSGDLVRMAALGSIPLASLLGGLTYPQLLGVAFVESAATVLLFSPAASIAVRDIVPKEHLIDAASRSNAANGSAALAGPALGGLLFEVNRMLPFGLDAASYLISAALLIGLTMKPPARTGAAAGRGWSLGVRWLRGQPVLLRVLAAALVINVAGTGLGVGIVLALQQNGARSSSIGAVMTCMGVGGLGSSLIAPKLAPKLRTTVWFAVTGVVWTLGFLVLWLTLDPWIVAPDLTVIIGVTLFGNIGYSAAIIGNAPRHLLGRINAVIGTATGGLDCVAPLIAGVLIQRVGAPTTWLIFAGLTTVATVTLILPLVRVDNLIIKEPEETVPGAEPEAATEALDERREPAPAAQP